MSSISRQKRDARISDADVDGGFVAGSALALPRLPPRARRALFFCALKTFHVFSRTARTQIRTLGFKGAVGDRLLARQISFSARRCALSPRAFPFISFGRRNLWLRIRRPQTPPRSQVPAVIAPLQTRAVDGRIAVPLRHAPQTRSSFLAFPFKYLQIPLLRFRRTQKRLETVAL